MVPERTSLGNPPFLLVLVLVLELVTACESCKSCDLRLFPRPRPSPLLLCEISGIIVTFVNFVNSPGLSRRNEVKTGGDEFHPRRLRFNPSTLQPA
jgi:hypothetical protein